MQERLTSARLLVVRRTKEGDEALLELAHESLVHTWPQLARWVEESNEESAVLAQVEAAARLWTLRGRRTSELWDLEAATGECKGAPLSASRRQSCRSRHFCRSSPGQAFGGPVKVGLVDSPVALRPPASR